MTTEIVIVYEKIYEHVLSCFYCFFKAVEYFFVIIIQFTYST